MTDLPLWSLRFAELFVNELGTNNKINKFVDTVARQKNRRTIQNRLNESVCRWKAIFNEVEIPRDLTDPFVLKTDKFDGCILTTGTSFKRVSERV